MRLKIHCKGCNIIYVEGFESSLIYIIRAVMLCMSKVSKEVQNGLPYISLLITFLIFNQFSILKKGLKS